MRNILIVLLAALAAVAAGRAEDAGRRAEKSFKGVELYSWRDPGSDAWRFALLPGTNRVKPESMIVDPANTIASVAELKKRLAGLAVGESVFWMPDHSEKVRFALPPKRITDEIVEFAKGLGLELSVPEG